MIKADFVTEVHQLIASHEGGLQGEREGKGHNNNNNNQLYL